MTQNELLAGGWLRDSLHEDSSHILTNYLKTYQPETLEQVFSFLERDFDKRRHEASMKYLETDGNKYKSDCLHWEHQIEMVSKARADYEEIEKLSPSQEGEVAFRYKYPSKRVEEVIDEGDEFWLRNQLLRHTKLCDEYEELINDLKTVCLSNPNQNYTEESFEKTYRIDRSELSTIREIETWYEWDKWSIVDKTQQVEYHLVYLTKKISLTKRRITYQKEQVEHFKPNG